MIITVAFNTNPVARRVVALTKTYYIITQRIECKKTATRDGCGKTYNQYEPALLEQMPKPLAAEFPAFLTHRSGLDRDLLHLIRAGMVRRVCARQFQTILQELHIRRHDLLELSYCHAIDEFKSRHGLSDLAPKVPPFSSFEDKTGFGGFIPSAAYINHAYQAYMRVIRPFLDQCMSALSGLLLRWDHTFKITKHLARIDGTPVFMALFTILNENEQIRWQGFVHTKAFSHLRHAFEGIVRSLKLHGLPQPILGFTDNVAADEANVISCVPSLAEGITPIDDTATAVLPVATLPENVMIKFCATTSEISSACHEILEVIKDFAEEVMMPVGFDMEWDFSPFSSRNGGGLTSNAITKKTALIQIALPTVVYVLHVYKLKALPLELVSVLLSPRIIKIGRNVGGDFAKLHRDFQQFNESSAKKSIIELGKLARIKGVVSTATASLAAITAAVFKQSLCKDQRYSEWSCQTLTSAQLEYAALDAHIALQIFSSLREENSILQPVTTSMPSDTLVTFLDITKKRAVAVGELVERPGSFTIYHPDHPANSRTYTLTDSRSLVKITNVLCPEYMVPYHQRTLESFGDPPFDLLCGTMFLLTRSSGSITSNIGQPELNLLWSATRHLPSPESITVPAPPEASDNASHAHDIDDPETTSSSDEEDISQFSYNPGYTQPSTSETITRRILADVWHVMNQLLKTIPRSHTARAPFSIAFSDTMLIPDQDDVARIQGYIAKLPAARNGKLLTWDHIRQNNSEWLWARVRRYIPEPGLLYRLLKKLFDTWGPIRCSQTKAPLFSTQSHIQVVAILEKAKKGHISDPPGIPLYVLRRHDSNGLPIYRCIRGTNSVEGSVHMVIRRVFGTLNGSVELSDSLLADWRHRHNIEIGSSNLYGTPYIGHFDTWIIHSILTLRASIDWETPPPPLPGESTALALSFTPTTETFGISAIPSDHCLTYGFAHVPPTTLLPSSSSRSSGTRLVAKAIISLNPKPRSRYDFLAGVQHTQFAVTPIHTAEEFKQFNEWLAVGGKCHIVSGEPDFEDMAKKWSLTCNGKTLFYKLPEHLRTHYQRWMERRARNVTLTLSEDQRHNHALILRDRSHQSKVLPATSRSHAGVHVVKETEAILVCLNCFTSIGIFVLISLL